MILGIAKKIFAFMVAAVLVFASFPVKTEAQTGLVKSAGKITSCSASGIAGQAGGQLISGGLDTLISKTQTQITRLLPSSISRFLNPLTGGGHVPVDDDITRGAWSTKENRMDIVARCLAREITDKMILNTLNIVRNHGRDGGPSFVTNWRNFTTGGQYRGENIFRAILSNTELCDHFDQGLKETFKATTPTNLRGQNTRTGNLDPYQLRADCTMPSGWTVENYQKDFSGNGGWLAFAKLTEPQNNILGSYNLALEEVDKQRYLEEQLDLTEAKVSGGFTSRRGRGSSDSCLLNAQNGQCIVYKDILTPGSVLQDSVAATVQQEIAWVTNADEIAEVISGFTGQLLNRLLSLSNNDDSRVIDPADLPTYVPSQPGSDITIPEEQAPPAGPGPTPGPCDPDDPTCTPNPGSGSAFIFGYVFEDLNENEIRDSNEPLVSGETVKLQTEDGETTITTSQTFQGVYTFGNLEAGEKYRVEHDVPSGYKRTTDDSTVVTATENGTNHDFGILEE